MPWHPWLREQLAQTLRESAPTSPTACEGWEARHLVAHLVLREHAPWRVLGGATDRLADEALDPAAYARLVDRFATPPPRWSPYSWAGEAMNRTELVIHTEDLRRGAGDLTPRELPPGLVATLDGSVAMTALAGYRASPVGVELVEPDGTAHRGRRARRGRGSVRVEGPPLELLLHASGRRRFAAVELTGDPDDVAAFRAALPA
ncbi:TIGR03085 family metal-binding protein [Cellulomonas sp. PhB143]|uniref:TIGR03085 family metal-binding protein n=1 Tax=Cellulomonas sp. PhB143 TaxID=2485186 RepID=UPI000F480B16|nr:TIGR03085 family metal-binding protein [Cellulomonas sp. PhB143]ROS74383.1 uncharacterized protein (TIGR03085 family) [Cellulomonas sp. PhB143]